MDKPKVSVCVITFNQKKYIRECLDSLINQRTNFNFEIIVGDDASTDGTAEIIQEYIDEFPGLVKGVLHKDKCGGTKNYFSVHNLAEGDYIAHVDGDDYALPGKLQVLKDHLDKYQDCAIVWHRMKILNELGQLADGMPIVPVSTFIKNPKLYRNDLAKYYGITGCHSGSMYRKSCRKIFFSNQELIDYYFTLSFLDGNFCAMYIEDIYGVYRYFKHEPTITRTKGNTIVGKGKLYLIEQYLKIDQSLRKEFSAQCIFELLLRTYFRQPLVKDFFYMLIRCKALPSLKDLFLILRVFNANRNSKLRKNFKNDVE